MRIQWPRWPIYQRPTEAEAEAAGRDAAINGPNTTNTHYRFFTTEALKEAWERGNHQPPRRALR